MTEDEMVGWYHGLDGHEFEQASGLGDGQGSLVCCSLWGHSRTRLSDCTTAALLGPLSRELSLAAHSRKVW